MSSSSGIIYIGTSGWSYGHWRGPFYPEDLSGKDLLAYYARRFRSVEINSTFYHLPSTRSLDQWIEATPADFVFSVKASRYITHMKKLREPNRTLPAFMENIQILGEKLGPLLFQLPPHWHFNAERLSGFLDSLGKTHRLAFEFRDHSWMNGHCYEILSRHHAAFCIHELGGFLTPMEITAGFVYLRLHGPGGAYEGSYSKKALAKWAGLIMEWAGQGLDVYCYFDNDQHGYAVQNATVLRKLLET